MPRETPFFNAMIPTLLLIFMFSVIVYLLLDRLLADWDLDRYVWHPALFRLSVFVCFFCAIGIWWYQ
ncbi:MAG: DUF1656 domain-containing protein [Acidithiobacillus sp.]